jgi:two-component system probable response regulator PhcQ
MMPIDSAVIGRKSVTVKLLCVDDNKFLLKCISLCASTLVWLDVYTANSAEHALKMVDRYGTFDVIISDYLLPEMNGVDLLRILKERLPESQRFIQSSSAETDTISAAIQEGIALRFYSKPVLAADFDDLLSCTCAQIGSNNHSV